MGTSENHVPGAELAVSGIEKYSKSEHRHWCQKS